MLFLRLPPSGFGAAALMWELLTSRAIDLSFMGFGPGFGSAGREFLGAALLLFLL